MPLSAAEESSETDRKTRHASASGFWVMITAGKYHSYGNDFLIVYGGQVKEPYYSSFAAAICDPHFGVGADGCIFVDRLPVAYSARIFNQDGSEAGMSGNGVRCVAAYLHHTRVGRETIEIATRSGRKVYTLTDSGDSWWSYRALMGQPAFDSRRIPFDAEPPLEQVRDHPLEVRGEVVRITALSVGNPQCAVLSDELPDSERFLSLGAALESHPLFPERTNVSFVKPAGPHEVQVLIYERGVGPTHSSGTGSCGAAVAAILAGVVESPVSVRTGTGVQTVTWTPGQEIELTGTAHFIADIKFHWSRRE